MDVFQPVYLMLLSVGAGIGGLISWIVNTRHKSVDTLKKEREIEKLEIEIKEKNEELREKKRLITIPTPAETVIYGKQLCSGELTEEITGADSDSDFSADSVQVVERASAKEEAFQLLDSIDPIYIRMYTKEKSRQRSSLKNL